MTEDMNTNSAGNNSARRIVVARPVHTIQDLGAGIIAAVYAPDSRQSRDTRRVRDREEVRDQGEVMDARPVPRNLDALADLLRETQIDQLVVAEWQVPAPLTLRLREVLRNEGISLTMGM